MTTSKFGVWTPGRWHRHAETCGRSEIPYLYVCFYLQHSVVFIMKTQKRYSSFWQGYQHFRSRVVRDFTDLNSLLKGIHSCSHYFINKTAETTESQQSDEAR